MRPSWHLDAKWLSALAAVFFILAASVSFMFYRLTDHDTATGAFTAIAVSLVEEQFDTEEFERIQAEAAASPDAEYTIPGVNVTITGQELAELTPTQALELVIGRASDTLYYSGPDAAQSLFEEEASDGPAPENGGEERSLSTGPFAIFSQDTHDFFQPLVLAFALTAAAAAIPLILFSRGFGRLGSPGMTLLVVTGPLTLLWAVARRAAGAATDQPDETSGRLAAALTPAIDDLARTFLVLAAVGGVAVALAVGGHVSSWIVARRKAGRTEPEAAVPAEAVTDSSIRETVADEGPSPHGDEFPSIGPGAAQQG